MHRQVLDWASLLVQLTKNPPAIQEMQSWSFNQEDALEKEMAIHSSILAWEIPRTEEPGGLQSTGLQRVGHNLVTEHLRRISSLDFFWKQRVAEKGLPLLSERNSWDEDSEKIPQFSNVLLHA